MGWFSPYLFEGSDGGDPRMFRTPWYQDFNHLGPLVLVGGGLIFGLVGFVEAGNEARTLLTFEQVSGVVVRSNVARSYGKGPPWRAEIDVSYTVAEQPLITRRLTWQHRGSSPKGSYRRYGTHGLAQAEVDRYPLGREVTVYHHPDDPRDAVVETGFTFEATSKIVLGLLAFVAGVTVFLFVSVRPWESGAEKP